MAKILALDIGKARTGVAETDPLQIIASGLPTVPTAQLLTFLEHYILTEKPESLIIGEPKRLHGESGEMEHFIQSVIVKIRQKQPEIPIYRVDERFTSKMAAAALSMSGMGKKKRQEKGRIDEISAVIILQSWLNRPR